MNKTRQYAILCNLYTHNFSFPLKKDEIIIDIYVYYVVYMFII